MAESWRTEKKRPKIKVLPWPAIPAPTVDEVYAGVDEKRKSTPSGWSRPSGSSSTPTSPSR